MLAGSVAASEPNDFGWWAKSKKQFYKIPIFSHYNNIRLLCFLKDIEVGGIAQTQIPNRAANKFELMGDPLGKSG